MARAVFSSHGIDTPDLDPLVLVLQSTDKFRRGTRVAREGLAKPLTQVRLLPAPPAFSQPAPETHHSCTDWDALSVW